MGLKVHIQAVRKRLERYGELGRYLRVHPRRGEHPEITVNFYEIFTEDLGEPSLA